MNNFLKYILDFIFPIECAGCGEELHTPNPLPAQAGSHRGELKWLCEHCFSKIEFNKKQICPLCGHFLKLGYSCVCTVGGVSSIKYQVSSNLKNTPLSPLKGGTIGCVDVYITFVDLKKNPQVMKLIHKLKYSFVEDAAYDLARIGIEFLKKNNLWEKFGVGEAGSGKDGAEVGEGKEGKEDVILFIPVPLHKKRLLWRGFNQSELILEKLVSSIKYQVLSNRKLEICADILVRKKNTLFQGKIKMRERDRILNMQDAFEARGKLEGKTVVLFDDVITTGATMEECARILKKAGVARVIAMAVGKG